VVTKNERLAAFEDRAILGNLDTEARASKEGDGFSIIDTKQKGGKKK